MRRLPNIAPSRIKPVLLFLSGITLLAAAIIGQPTRPARGQENLPGNPDRGGRLYAAWDLITDEPLPTENQPLWPQYTDNSVPIRVTWRCVSCHGWDYRGSNSQTQNYLFQGMQYPSLFSMMEKPADEILPWLNGENNPDHDFSPHLSERDLDDLSAFLSTGLMPPDFIASVDTNVVFGTLSVGETGYFNFCSSCHGQEGEKINFGTTQTPIFMGDLAFSNPWHVAHIIRFGHFSAMVPQAVEFGLSFSQQIDILAYTQTLPTASVITDPQYQAIDFESQASTEPLAFGAMLLAVVVFAAVLLTLRRRQA